MYHISYHTGAGNEEANTLLEAKAIADQNAAYTQQPITISDDEGNVVARRDWWGVEFDAEEDPSENPITFGDFGYYSDWVDA